MSTNNALVEELRQTIDELRRENADLRRQITELRVAVIALMEPDMPRVLRTQTAIMVLDQPDT